MKKFLTVAALIWVFFLLQTSVCPWIAFGSIKPNLLVILVASIGFMEGSKAGMWTGFACGLFVWVYMGRRCRRRVGRISCGAVYGRISILATISLSVATVDEKIE